MESMLSAQQNQDGYIEQLASKVDVLNTYNKMLDAQVAQQASSSPSPLGTLPDKHESNPHEHCNYVALKDGYRTLGTLMTYHLGRVEK